MNTVFKKNNIISNWFLVCFQKIQRKPISQQTLEKISHIIKLLKPSLSKICLNMCGNSTVESEIGLIYWEKCKQNVVTHTYLSVFNGI